MPTLDSSRSPSGHHGLLRSRTYADHAETRIDSWLRTAVQRGRRICAVGALPHPSAATSEVTVLSPADIHPSATPLELVQQALADGFRGLGVLIHADEVIADRSGRFHDAVETTLTDLCVDHPIEVLCVYDRPGAGTDCVDLAVAHHGGDLRGPQITVRRAAGAVHVGGEIDMTNLDVFDAALQATAVARGRRLRIDLDRVAFLSAGAAHVLHQYVAAVRGNGAHVELHGVAPPVARVLELVERSFRSSG